MVNIIKKQQQENKQLLNEIETLKTQLKGKEQEVEQLKTPLQNAIENIKENGKPEIAGTLMTLEQHFLPKNVNELTLEDFVKGCAEWIWNNCEFFSYVSKKNEELKERNAVLELLEPKVAELEVKQKDLETEVKELDDEVWMEREEAEKALNAAMKWRKNQMAEVVLKHDAAMGKLLDRIDLLEDNLAAKNQEIDWKNYLENKELPELPKQQKENKLHKLKKLVSRAKEKTKEKFQTFIIQKHNSK